MLCDAIGAGILIAYYLVFCLLLPTALKAWARVPAELVRKLQHVAYSLSVFLLLRLFSAWYWAIAAAALLVLLAYPCLMALERSPRYRRLFVDRAARGGELRKQLIYVQLSFAVLIAVFWGDWGSGGTTSWPWRSWPGGSVMPPPPWSARPSAAGASSIAASRAPRRLKARGP